MLAHVLGWITLVATAMTAIGAMGWLWDAAKEKRSWLAPLHVPKPSSVTLSLSSGSDFVGPI